MNQLLPRISARRWSRPIRLTDQLKILCSNTINVGAGRLRDKNPNQYFTRKLQRLLSSDSKELAKLTYRLKSRHLIPSVKTTMLLNKNP